MEERISLEKVQVALNSKDWNEKFDTKASNARHDLITRERSYIRDNCGVIRRLKSKTYEGGFVSSIKCFIARRIVTP